MNGLEREEDKMSTVLEGGGGKTEEYRTKFRQTHLENTHTHTHTETHTLEAWRRSGED